MNGREVDVVGRNDITVAQGRSVVGLPNNWNVRELTDDKRYASRANLEAINEIGADAFIPFRSTTVADRVGDLYKKAFAFFSFTGKTYFFPTTNDPTLNRHSR